MVQRHSLGSAYAVSFEVAAWGADAADVDLSFACMFTREANETGPTGGLLRLDQQLGCRLTSFRQRGFFSADELDSVRFVLDQHSSQPRSVVVIGLGDILRFNSKLMERVTRFATKEAVRLGAATAAFAPSLLDSGVASVTRDSIEAYMIKGVFDALATESELAKSSGSNSPTLRRWSFDAGVSHYPQAVEQFQMSFDACLRGRTLKEG